MNKITNFLALILHLGLFLFWLIGATLYVPNSPATPFLWLIAFVIILFGTLEIIYRINNHKVNKAINAYYKTNDPIEKRSIKEKFYGSRNGHD